MRKHHVNIIVHRSGYILVFIKYSAYVQFFLSFGLLSALMLIKWGSNFQNAYIYIYIYIYGTYIKVHLENLKYNLQIIGLFEGKYFLP